LGGFHGPKSALVMAPLLFGTLMDVQRETAAFRDGGFSVLTLPDAAASPWRG
jgi:hypothetical protein